MSTLALRLSRLARLPSKGVVRFGLLQRRGKYVANECHARDGKGDLEQDQLRYHDGLQLPQAGLIFLEPIVPNRALAWHATGHWLALAHHPAQVVSYSFVDGRATRSKKLTLPISEFSRVSFVAG